MPITRRGACSCGIPPLLLLPAATSSVAAQAAVKQGGHRDGLDPDRPAGGRAAAIAGYIHSVPTWTDTLDAFAMMRIGAGLERVKLVRLIGIRDVEKRDLETLEKLDGLIGVVDRDALDREAKGAGGSIAGDNEGAKPVAGDHEHDMVGDTASLQAGSWVPLMPLAAGDSHTAGATRLLKPGITIRTLTPPNCLLQRKTTVRVPSRSLTRTRTAVIVNSQ